MSLSTACENVEFLPKNQAEENAKTPDSAQMASSDSKNLGYKGSYANYYIANNKILVPNYNDANDAVANQIIQKLYPIKTIVGIDVRNLYANGGMIHCVTQQQPK